MKSHSARDKEFMRVFAQKLSDARKKAKEQDGISYGEFAGKLGVTRAGISKYLNEKNVPSLDILERAKQLGVEVKYGDLNVGVIKRRAKQNPGSPEAQMLLPLAIENLTDQNVHVEVSRRKPNGIELSVTISFSRKLAGQS
jgi:transcriptional regulator with XRE-family HTH domain